MKHEQVIDNLKANGLHAEAVWLIALIGQRAELLEALKFAKKELIELHNEAGEYEYVNYAIIDDAIDNAEK